MTARKTRLHPLLADACRCRGAAACDTCRAFTLIFDGAASRRAEAAEQAIESRRTARLLARHQRDINRRPVRDMPRRLPFDLEALADAVALRLRRPA